MGAERILGRAMAIAASAGMSAGVAVAQPVIRDLGTLGGTISYGNAISADGTVVVGSATIAGDAGTHAYRWTVAGGMQDVGVLLAGGNSYATCVSGDGQVVAGFAPASGSGVHAFRWTAAGLEDCGTLGGKDSMALALNGDGSMTGGIASLSTSGGAGARGHACVWLAQRQPSDLGALGGVESKVYGISSDGSVVVGTTDIVGSTAMRAFRWTNADGMVELGTLGGSASRAFAVSGDGSSIVGYAESTPPSPGSGGGGRAFRWTSATGMRSLGTLGGAASAAYAVSADGRVVAGYDSVPFTGSSHAFVWTEADGMRDLNTLLPTLGCDLTGWTLTGVNGISADGNTLTGNGIHNGRTRGFVISGLLVPPCRADFDGSGAVAPEDIFAFLTSWFTGQSRADIDSSGGLTEQDIHAFLNVWFAGC